MGVMGVATTETMSTKVQFRRRVCEAINKQSGILRQLILQKQFHQDRNARSQQSSKEPFHVNGLNSEGEAPLHTLIRCACAGTLDRKRNAKLLCTEQRRAELVFSLLTTSSADVNLRTRTVERLTPLHMAVEEGDEVCTMLLIAFGADINARDGNDRTPLDVAILLSRQSIARLLTSIDSCHSQYPYDINTRGTRGLYQKHDGTAAELNEVPRVCQPHGGNAFEDCICDRVLCLDGGGMRGLVQLETLAQLERSTGKRITELFDWVVGTSTGAIILLALIYGQKSLAEIKNMYFGLKEKVITKKATGFGFDSKALEDIFLSCIGAERRMSDIRHPKVLITAVNKARSVPELHLFNNCFQNEFSNELVWKVARYTSAAPLYFTEFENYVDGGVLANNPCELGLTAIQGYYRAKGVSRPLSLVVSIGTGLPPTSAVGNTDIQEYASFGRHWLHPKGFITRARNLLSIVESALTESEIAVRNCRCRCEEQGIPFYRLNPSLKDRVSLGETDIKKLLRMIIETRVQLHGQGFHELCRDLLRHTYS